MRRLDTILLLVSVAVLGLGCPVIIYRPPDGGTIDDVPPEEVLISVSGTARVHPLGAAYLADAGFPEPDLTGVTLRVEEPFRVALNDPLGVFGSVTLGDAGAFSVANVRTVLVNLGVGAGIRDETDAGCGADGGAACGPRVIRSATTLFDVALEGKKPDQDIVGAKAWAIPAELHARLTAAITPAVILQISSNQFSTLVNTGFIFGQVVDTAGAPVAGVTIEPSPSSLSPQFFYPTADLGSTQASTSANGSFIFVHDGSDVKPFKFKVAGRSEYLTRNGGAARDACLVITVFPGRVAP